MFLLLGSCPAKKAFQSFLDPLPKEQSALGKGKSALSSPCTTDNSFAEQIALSERTLTVNSTFLVLAVFFVFPFPFINERLNKSFYRVFVKAAPDPVPVFLRNRSILI